MFRIAQSITSCVSRFTPAIGRLLFRLRSLTAIPFILIVIYFSRPTLASALVGTMPLILGEFLRLWAVGYAGGATRSRSLGAASDLVTTGPCPKSALFREPTTQSRCLRHCQCLLDDSCAAGRIFYSVPPDYRF